MVFEGTVTIFCCLYTMHLLIVVIMAAVLYQGVCCIFAGVDRDFGSPRCLGTLGGLQHLLYPGEWPCSITWCVCERMCVCICMKLFRFLYDHSWNQFSWIVPVIEYSLDHFVIDLTIISKLPLNEGSHQLTQSLTTPSPPSMLHVLYFVIQLFLFVQITLKALIPSVLSKLKFHYHCIVCENVCCF